MGRRLYPNTKDIATLERLVTVPEGTFAKLTQAKAVYSGNTEAYYDWLFATGNEDCNVLDNFLTFGYGKFRFPPEYVFKNGSDDISGRETDQLAVEKLLNHNGIMADVALLKEGVNWN